MIGGVACLFSGVLSAVNEFDDRFKKSAQQFRKNENALQRLSDALQNLSNGDLSTEIPTSEDPLVQEVSDRVHKLTVLIQDTVNSIDAAINLADHKSKQLNKRSEKLIDSYETQSSEISSVVRLFESSKQLTDLNAVDTESALYSSKIIINSLQDGGRSVKDAVENIDGIRDNIHEATKRIKQLGERSQEIGKVVAILSTFAEQINILGLNASLEAERAGEYGRGFSVVASEVRKLSGRAEEYVSSISLLVQSIQADTRDSIDSLERATTKVVNGSHVAGLSASSMQMIEALIEDLANIVATLNSSTNLQSTGNREFAKLMSQLVLASNDFNANLTELRTESISLNESVSDARARIN